MDDDSPWDDNVQTLKDSEWSKISSDFMNVGYREGITAGKEAHLQQGFDEGFAKTGAPLGREIGLLRGFASAILSFLKSPACTVEPSIHDGLLQDARAIFAELNRIRFSDIVPPDPEAEQHEREHLDTAAADRDDEIVMNEELQQKRDLESLEDMMGGMGASGAGSKQEQKRPTQEDVTALAARLRALTTSIGLPFPSIN
ncbi:hypothetical protein BDY19DRAFT_889447 [Irpex rosettiformis]|uniref:Uncharacterized protein n=1 Tax=Irpex rosettiformis TaxID=378272 RepID=A0ACB8U5S2_9APHY|nr:hypothetical protein BDY19DRAFT_889447 [Irpex rosettiformis]